MLKMLYVMFYIVLLFKGFAFCPVTGPLNGRQGLQTSLRQWSLLIPKNQHFLRGEAVAVLAMIPKNQRKAMIPKNLRGEAALPVLAMIWWCVSPNLTEYWIILDIIGSICEPCCKLLCIVSCIGMWMYVTCDNETYIDIHRHTITCDKWLIEQLGNVDECW